MKRLLGLILSFVILFNFELVAQSDSLTIAQDSIEEFVSDSVLLPSIELSEFVLFRKAEDPSSIIIQTDVLTGPAAIEINGDSHELDFIEGEAILPITTDHQGGLYFFNHSHEGKSQYSLYHLSDEDGAARIKKIPLWLSIIPPLVAILLALVFREVYVSLFVGIWSGAFIAGGLRLDSFYYFFLSLFKTIEKYIINALNDGGHLSVLVFSMLIGGMVAIISKNGGMAGVVKALSKYAKSPASSQFITWLLGVAIFFDDYANTLIVGNTMRSVTDRFKVSREKLAYIVDSTAAPVAAIAFITTWIGAELGYIDDGMSRIDIGVSMTPYAIFLSSLKYSFYPIMTLIFILFIIRSQKDYGPMHKAETRARSTGQVSSASTPDEDEPNMEDLSPVKGAPLKWFNAVIPVATVILVTIFGLVDTGMNAIYESLVGAGINVENSWSGIWGAMQQQMAVENPGFFSKLGNLIGNSDSYVALLWASLSGVIVAILLTVGGRIMKLFDTMHWMVTGFKTMMPALIILTLAWALALTTNELHTADYLSSALQDSINPYVIPMIIFILSALIAFSTGSSWSTMAILYPIAIPTTYAICQANGLEADITLEILLNVIATVLGASVMGDHCSPISDTTILSSLASDCNHIDHVRTQLPYALTVGVVAISMVGLSTFLGGGWMICFILLVIGLAILYAVVHFFGKTVS